MARFFNDLQSERTLSLSTSSSWPKGATGKKNMIVVYFISDKRCTHPQMACLKHRCQSNKHMHHCLETGIGIVVAPSSSSFSMSASHSMTSSTLLIVSIFHSSSFTMSLFLDEYISKVIMLLITFCLFFVLIVIKLLLLIVFGLFEFVFMSIPIIQKVGGRRAFLLFSVSWFRREH